MSGGTEVETIWRGPEAPIFVVGHPRSGTTLLASMLGRHPQIASTPESQFVLQVRYDLRLRPGIDGTAVARQAMATPLSHLIGDEATFARDLDAAFAADGVSERTVFAAALEHFRIARGKPRILEKTPGHLLYLRLLLRWFPDARVVWILRDGRGSIASLRKVDWATHDVGRLSRQWVRNMGFGLAGAEEIGDALVRIRYEDLLTSPEATMATVCSHVGVPMAPEMFDHAQSVTTVKANEVGWKANVNRPLMADRTEAWRHELAPEDVAVATRIMLPMLRRLGYEPEGPPAAPGAVALDAAMSSAPVRVAFQSVLYAARRTTGSKPAFMRRLRRLRGLGR